MKETLNARSHYGSSEDDGGTVHRINQYSIKQEIGRGSFGSVHLAVDQFGHEFVSFRQDEWAVGKTAGSYQGFARATIADSWVRRLSKNSLNHDCGNELSPICCASPMPALEDLLHIWPRRVVSIRLYIVSLLPTE